jgi:hypothetical protein
MASWVRSYAHIVFRPKFLCIYLASEFYFLFGRTTRLRSGLRMLLLLLLLFLFLWTATCIIIAIFVISIVTYIHQFIHGIALFNLPLCPILPTLTHADLSGSRFLVSPLRVACHYSNKYLTSYVQATHKEEYGSSCKVWDIFPDCTRTLNSLMSFIIILNCPVSWKSQGYSSFHIRTDGLLEQFQ